MHIPIFVLIMLWDICLSSFFIWVEPLIFFVVLYHMWHVSSVYVRKKKAVEQRTQPFAWQLIQGFLVYLFVCVQVVSLKFRLTVFPLTLISSNMSSFHVPLCQYNLCWFFHGDVSNLWMQWESFLGAIIEKCKTSEGICIFICIPLEIWHESTGCWWRWGD